MSRPSSARDEILARIRASTPSASPTVPRGYRRNQGAGDVDLFAERVADYRATVHRLEGAGIEVAAAITRILTGRGLIRVVVPEGFPPDWHPDIEVVAEPVGVATLDEVGAVVTTVAIAVAETGTVVLDAGPGMGPRRLSLVPDYHLAVVRSDQIVANVPEAIAALDPVRPLTWIGGPSATSDIELDRVEGVHGPRTLDVLIV